MNVSLTYALTRMHARVAERPTPLAHKRLLAVGDFGHFLQAAARVGFGRWLTRLGPASTSHQIELSLRLRFRDLLNEVARWLPERWAPGIDWLKLAPELPALDRLLRGEAAPAWMRQDPMLAPLLDEAGQLDRAALARFLPALADVEPDMLDQRWLSRAHLALPLAGDTRGLLLGQIEPDSQRNDPLELERVFRRRPEAEMRILAFFALARRDLEFLRGQLTRRRLLQAGG